MELKTASFKYQPLQPRRIRIFDVEPGGPDDEVTGVLVEKDLDALDQENDTFAALSYLWGSATNETAVITVKNIETGQSGALTITRSLWITLKRLQNPLGSSPVWIDQICIDQSNNEEKGEQILLMRLIYQRAKYVVAVLEKQEEWDFAMDLLLGDEWSKIVPFNNALDASLSRLGQESTAKNCENAVRAVGSLLSQRYWNRTWIWQEVTAKSDYCLVCCGMKQIHLRAIIAYIVSYRGYMATNAVKHETWDSEPVWRMTRFIDYWWTRRSGTQSPLLALLDEVRQTDITDPRDKIFAVLPFSSDAAQEIQPDYRRSAHEVYTKYALWQMVKYQSLDVITFSKGVLGHFLVDNEQGRTTTVVGESTLNKPIESINRLEDFILATWVPDWRARSPTLNPEVWTAPIALWPLPKSEHIYDPTLPRLYKASGSESPALNFTFLDARIIINGLTVQGVRVATLAHVERSDGRGDLDLGAEEDWYHEFQAMNISNWEYSGDHLFKRTIYADITFRGDTKGSGLTRHFRTTCPDDELIWPDVTQAEDPLLQVGELKNITRNRSPFRTTEISESETGLYGLGPAWAQEGDEVWILRGASVPVVLRPGKLKYSSGSLNANLITGLVEEVTSQPGDSFLTFMGECFVLGLMDAEVLELMTLDECDSRRSQVPELEREFHPITLF